jgi:hypothetical protein
VFFRGDHIKPEIRKLEFYGRYWDLAQPIFTCKKCGLPIALFVTEKAMSWNEKGVRSRVSLELPTAYLAAGITKLVPAKIMLWRPVCMHRLSTHSQIPKNSSTADFAQSPDLRASAVEHLRVEINELEHTRQLLASTIAAGVATIAVSLATMTWEPEKVVKQLAAFLPQLGLKTELGRADSALLLNPENGDKFQANFGSLHPPGTTGFSLERAACLFDGPEFSVLTQADMARLVEVSAYLHSVS